MKWLLDLLTGLMAAPGVSVTMPLGTGYSVDADRAAAVAKLRAACDMARMNPAYRPGQPGPTDTHCNGNAAEVARAFGFLKLEGLMANQQVALLSSDPDWKATPDAARFGDHALKGGLGFATVVEYPHGHLCPGYPDPAQLSGTWGGLEPIVSNVGKTVGVMKLSGAFLLTQKPLLRFFLFQPGSLA